MKPVSDRDEIGTASKAFLRMPNLHMGGSWGGGGGGGGGGRGGPMGRLKLSKNARNATSFLASRWVFMVIKIKRFRMESIFYR